MMLDLGRAFDRLEAEDSLRVGILYGHGAHFCAGLDLIKFAPFMTGDQQQPVFDGIDPLQLKARCSKPLVAAVSGVTFTVGIELMLACDIVVAGEDSRFSQLETSLGIMASGGGTVRWIQRVGWGNAMRHLLTADRFDAAEALRIGLVQEVVASERVLDRSLELARQIAANAPLAVRATKESSLQYLVAGQSAAFSILETTQARLARSADAMEAARAMMQQRAARFIGA